MFLTIFHLVSSLFSIFNLFIGLISDFAHIVSWCIVCILLALNSSILYVLTQTKWKEYFTFQFEHKWLKPNTLFIPFELNICLCNYFMFKISLLGYGVDLRIKWRDIARNVTQTVAKQPTTTHVIQKKDEPEKIKII